MILTYRIEGHDVIPVADRDWHLQPIEERQVARDQIGDAYVSTVFLGVVSTFRDGQPLLFETAVFDGTAHYVQERYATWDEALAGHRLILVLVQAAEEEHRA